MFGVLVKIEWSRFCFYVWCGSEDIVVKALLYDWCGSEDRVVKVLFL